MRRIRSISYILVLLTLGSIVLYFFFRHVFGLILPFLIAWAVAFITRSPARRLNRILGIPVPALRVMLSILITLSILGIAALLIYLIGYELVELIGALVSGDAIGALIDSLADFISRGALDSLGDVIGDALSGILTSLAATIGSHLSTLLGGIPAIFIFVLVTVISSVYFSLDLERINECVGKILPRSVYNFAVSFKQNLFTVGAGYLRSYLALMLVTFSIILVGLLLLGRDHALLLALVIALLDLLPVIGVGTILIPWGLYEIILGSPLGGVGLLVLFLVHELIRQFIEPRILAHHLGVHPVVSLITVYVGCSLFGFVGLLLLPIVSVLLNICFGKIETAEVDEPLCGK